MRACLSTSLCEYFCLSVILMKLSVSQYVKIMSQSHCEV